MRRFGFLLVTFLLGSAGDAAAQGRLVERSSQALSFQGAVEVEFRGAPEAGCAATGMCDVSGTVSYVPGGQGQLVFTSFRRRDGSMRRDAMAFSFGFGPTAGQTVGITRRGDRQCVDVRASDGGPFDVKAIGADVRLGLVPARQFGFGSGDQLRTRCAGPRAADVLAAIGTRRVSRKSLADGQTISFAADAPFSAGGLAGTVRSSARIVLSPARRQVIRRRTVRRRPAPRRVRRTRQVSIPMRLVRIDGAATLNFAGDPATCRRLDSCGLTGTTTITPRPASARAFFFLSAGSRSAPAALAAVGRGRGRAAPINGGGGGASWTVDRGRASTVLTRDGIAGCITSADPLSGGALDLRVDRASRRLRVSLFGSGLGVSRCPGPLAIDLNSPSQQRTPLLATGTVPLTALRNPRLTVPLTQGGALTGPGYLGRTRITLTVVLTRGRVRLGP